MPPDYVYLSSALDAVKELQQGLNYRSAAEEFEHASRAYIPMNALQEDFVRRATESLVPTTASTSHLSDLARDTALSSAFQQSLLPTARDLVSRTSDFTSIRPSVGDLMDRGLAFRDFAGRASDELLDHNFGIRAGTALSSIENTSAYAVFEDQANQLRLAATALEPLQRLSTSLAETLGASADLQSVRDSLASYAAAERDQPWSRDYQSLAALAADAMLDEIEDEEDAEDSDESTPAADLENERENTQQADVYLLAIKFVVPSFELSTRLKQLARRIDPLVADDSWDRQILLIAHEFPHHAVDLTQLAYPLLQRLAWRKAPVGECANDTVEALTDEDADEFAHLADSMCRLLREIEKSIP